MMEKLHKSIIFRLVGVIISVQLFLFLIMGLFNVQYFSGKIQTRFNDQIQVPGRLMMHNALRFDTVNEPLIMQQFIGEDLEEALLVGLDQSVYYSLRPEHRGKMIKDLEGLEFIGALGESLTETKLAQTGRGRSKSIICITPVQSESGMTLGYLYLKAGTHQLQNEKAMIVLLFVAGSFIGLGILAGIGYFFSKKFEKRIQHLIALFKDIAEGEGDLSRRIPISTNDELGKIAHYYNLFTQKLENIISEVQRTVADLASAFYQISSTSEEISVTTTQQSKQLDNITAAIHQMGNALKSVSSNTETMCKQADETSQYAGKGKSINQELKSSVLHVQEREIAFSEELQALENSSNAINNIIGVISEITDQINLLALNAAIEASRAGEHGKGFSVVADEVRTLAVSTRKSTEDITKLVHNIHQKILAVVKAMGGNVEMINEVAKQSDTATEMNESITETSHKTLYMIEQANDTYRQQSDAMDSIRKNVQSISNASMESTKSLTQMADTMQEMNERVNGLRNLVKTFIVSNT